MVQANRFNDFYVSVKVAASAKAKALCHHNGFSVESVELVVPAADDLKNTNKFEFHAVTEQDTEKIVKHIPSNIKLSLPHVVLLGKNIKSSPVVKDLEVWIDSALTFDDHVSKLSSSCLYSLRRINRIKHLLDNKTLVLIINTLIFSRLFYCSTVWGYTSSKNISKLQLIQNFACRIILGIKKIC